MNTVNNTDAPKPVSFNRYAFITFIAAALVFLMMKDYNNTVIFSGLAPVFDPFDNKVKFSDRKKWQNAVLIANLALTFTAIVLAIIK